MMAAASGAVAAQQTHAVAEGVAAFAAAANLATTTIGSCFTLFLSLPAAVYVDTKPAWAWAMMGTLALKANRIGYQHMGILKALPGMAQTILAVVVGMLIYRLIRRKIPAVCWVSFMAMALTFQGPPGYAGDKVFADKVILIEIATTLLAFAGLSIAKDMPVLKSIGWLTVVKSHSANAVTFLFATIIAQLLVRF